MKKKDERKELEMKCINEYEHWRNLYRYGGQDPLYEDGINLDLTRNHIISYKRDMEKLDYFPEIYNKELPPEIDSKYMARADEIRAHAKKSFEIYKADENYQFLVKHRNDISSDDARDIRLTNVINYVDGLLMFILSDDLVGMRRHERPQIYQESFIKCREKLEKLLTEEKPDEPEKLGQLSIFDFI